jgi:chaperonin GroES
MFQKLRPLGNHVWVELIDKNEKTAGGLYIPDAAKEKTQTAKVLATGPGKQNMNGTLIPMQVAVGDTVFFGKFSGIAAGDKFMVLKEEDILGIVEL